MRKLRGNGESVRKWSARHNEREREFHLCISLFLLQNINISHFFHKTLKYVPFCRKMLKYGTFCRECCKNLNIRTMRKWFWIKSGCEEALQVVLAWCFMTLQNITFLLVFVLHIQNAKWGSVGGRLGCQGSQKYAFAQQLRFFHFNFSERKTLTMGQVFARWCLQKCTLIGIMWAISNMVLLKISKILASASCS